MRTREYNTNLSKTIIFRVWLPPSEPVHEACENSNYVYAALCFAVVAVDAHNQPVPDLPDIFLSRRRQDPDRQGVRRRGRRPVLVRLRLRLQRRVSIHACTFLDTAILARPPSARPPALPYNILQQG